MRQWTEPTEGDAVKAASRSGLAAVAAEKAVDGRVAAQHVENTEEKKGVRDALAVLVVDQRPAVNPEVGGKLCLRAFAARRA